ncbi:MAG: VWA domain-containing protein [Thermodesulfobacteriota bacterium]
MNLTFFNPFLLAGLAAAILPILIHRITRKKAVIRKFSAVRLLMQSQLITARPQRLKHLLLLALRILAVAALVFMMARPVLVRPGLAALPDNGARVLILDNSLSMGFREDRGQRFELARKAVRGALKDFGGRVALIPTVRTPKETEAHWQTSAAALKTLQEIPLSFGRGDMVSAFARAYRQMENLKIPRQILVFSDMVRSDWEELNAGRVGVVSDAEIIFLRIGGAGRDPNFRIKTVSLAAGDITAGVPTALAATVSNLSGGDASIHAELLLNGKKTDQKRIDLKPGADGSVMFDILIENPGWVDGEIKLAGDRLAVDDSFYFPLKVNDKTKVLIVDGDPTVSLKESESFYLSNALRPGGPEAASFLVRVISENELRQTDLQPFDILCLLNVARPDFSRPAAFLQAGRPVMMFLGDRVVPEWYNQFGLAPWQIQGQISRNTGAEKATGIHEIEAVLPFPAALQNNLKSASFYSYFRVDGAGKALLTLKDRDPLLLGANAGKSRLFLFTSSADLDWNDLPLKAAYVPLIQGLVKEAAGLTGASLPAGVSWGETFGGDGRPIQTKGVDGGPGIYHFRRSGSEFRIGVQIPPGESDLVKLTAAELKKKFGPMDVQIMEDQEDSFEKRQGGRRELWPLLLGFLLAVLAVEMILADGILSFRKEAAAK